MFALRQWGKSAGLGRGREGGGGARSLRGGRHRISEEILDGLGIGVQFHLRTDV